MDKESLRRRKIEENELKTEAIYNKYPEIKRLEQQIQKLSLSRIQGAFSDYTKNQLRDLDNQVMELIKEKEAYLRSLDLSQEDFEPDWDCKKCSDRGYTQPGVLCECYTKQKKYDLLEKSGITGEMRYKTFDNFDLNYYTDPQSIRDKVQRALMFADGVRKNRKQKSMYLFGDVGTGKTHFSLAIANQLLSYHHSVIYKRIDDLLELIIEYKYEDRTKKEQLEALKTADLLVIDDLGTEKTSEFALNQIKILLEERANLNKAMIINSNLDLDKLQKYYGSRISDRIIENFEIFELKTSESIRVQKRGKG